VEGAASAASTESASDSRGPSRTPAPVLHAGEAAVDQPRQVNWLAHVFLILGLGLLVICGFEMVNAARHFPTLGPFSTASEGLRRLSYYAGVLLYTNCARILTGFGLFAGGVLISRITEEGRGWDRAIRVTGLVMGGIGIVYLLIAMLVAIPFAPPPYGLRVLLPPPWAAVCILLTTGAALLGAGFLMASRLSPSVKGEALSRRLWHRAGTSGKRSSPAGAMDSAGEGGARG
jgi:hypothetical protein